MKGVKSNYKSLNAEGVGGDILSALHNMEMGGAKTIARPISNPSSESVMPFTQSLERWRVENLDVWTLE